MEKEKVKAEKELMTAYMTAYFHRVEKLEPFETYRKRLDGSEPQNTQMSDNDMLNKIMQLHKTMNGQTAEKQGVLFLLKKFTVNLDIEQQASNNAIFINSNDSNSFNLTLNILESAVAKNLTGITSAYLDVMKPDGTVTSVLCTVTTATAGVLTVTLAQTVYPLLGQYKALVKITDSDGSIATTNSFVFVVQSGW